MGAPAALRAEHPWEGEQVLPGFSKIYFNATGTLVSEQVLLSTVCSQQDLPQTLLKEMKTPCDRGSDLPSSVILQQFHSESQISASLGPAAGAPQKSGS